MRTEIVSFKREHLKFLHERKKTASVALAPDQFDLMERDPWTVTLTVDGEVVLCGGIYRHWQGRGECWAVISDSAEKHPVTVFRAANRMIRVAQHSLVRIEAVVNPDDSKAVNFVEHLGFTEKGARMKFYFPDNADGVMYARFQN